MYVSRVRNIPVPKFLINSLPVERRFFPLFFVKNVKKSVDYELESIVVRNEKYSIVVKQPLETLATSQSFIVGIGRVACNITTNRRRNTIRSDIFLIRRANA